MKLKCPACGKIVGDGVGHVFNSKGYTLCGSTGKIVKMKKVR